MTILSSGDRRNHYPEGKVRLFLERHQEPPGQQVQGGCGQEGGHPQQVAISLIKFVFICVCACHSVLKKMREEGVLVAGAQPGRKGAGCFKISPEEKSRMAGVAKAAAKKLKAQQKQGLGKVCWGIS